MADALTSSGSLAPRAAAPGSRAIRADVKVSVVVVNWNRADDTLLCVNHLLKQPYRNIEVIVVDNGSTDGSVEALKQVAGVQLLELGSNMGPSTARNMGLELATGKYTLFIDSDAVLSKKGMQRMVERMEADPTIGILGCKVVNAFSRRIDQWIYHQDYATHGRQMFETYSFSAAGAMVRTDAFKAVGGFWDRLFIYNEEVDLSIRLIRAGYKVIYDPRVYVFHRVSPKGRAKSGKYFYYQIRNWIWIFYRYYPAAVRRKKIALYAGVYAVKGLLSLRLGSCIKGMLAGLRERGIIAQYAEKLTDEQVRHLESLNSRTTIRFGR